MEKDYYSISWALEVIMQTMHILKFFLIDWKA